MERVRRGYVADHVGEGEILDMERGEFLHQGLLQRIDLGPSRSAPLHR